ncbi:MAG: hypothetical protein Fur0018_12630 [Anaerolineales bacterium]
MLRLRSLLQPPDYEQPQQQYAAMYLHYLLLTGMALILFFLMALPALQFPNQTFIFGSLGTTLLVALITFGLLHIRRLASAGFLLLTAIWGAFTVSAIAEGGLEMPNTAGYLVFIMMSGIIFGGAGSLFSTGLSIVTTLGIFLAEKNGWVVFSPEMLSPLSTWSTYLIYFLLGGSGMFIYHRGLGNVLAELQESHATLQTQKHELQNLQAELENRVEARTQELAKQTALLQGILQVSRTLTAQDTTEQLLMDVTERIQKYFGYYHVGIYLLDAEGEYVVLRAASSEGGQRLIAAGHQLKVGSEGIIGFVAKTGRPRIALDIGADPFFISLPELPDTRSEVALPLMSGGQLLGVLDIESEHPKAFSDDDISALQLLADQVAATLENARLSDESREALRRAEEAYAQISAQSWREYQRKAAWRGYRGTGHRVAPLQSAGRLSPKIRTALNEGRLVTDGSTLYLPIQVRQKTIARLKLRKKENEPWQESELTWMKTVSDQIAQALESARLYQESRQRAAREQLLSTSTARMRETLDMQSVLQIAVRELRQALNLADAEVRLATPETVAPENGKATDAAQQE